MNDPATTAEVPILPRHSFFGNPSRWMAQISPDGTQLAWMQPLDGVGNIFVAPRRAPTQARAVTARADRAPAGYMFSMDGRHILYMVDARGDENTQVYSVDLETGEHRLLTPFEGARCTIMAASRHIRDEIVIGANDRDPRFHDLWRVNIRTGDRRLIEENTGFASYVFDDHLDPVIGVRAQADGSFDLCRRTMDASAAGTDRWCSWGAIPADDTRTTRAMHLDASAETLFMLDSRGHNTAALTAIDLASGAVTVIAQDARADVAAVLTDSDSYRPIGWGVGVERLEYHALTDEAKGAIDFLNASRIGDWSVTSETLDGRTWLVSANSDVRPGIAYVYDRDAQTLDMLFNSRPELENARLSRMYPLTVPTGDGLSLICYLTLPAQFDTSTPEGPLSISRKVPLVLDIHGGPATRDSFGYNRNAQWLANRGYAVLQVNYRGSLGFGKAFLEAGDREWGAAMSDDIDAAADHVVGLGLVAPDKMAITGGSYGGYAVLAAMTRTPERYACGVDLVGPSNLETLLASVPAYWASWRQNLVKSIGDPDSEEGRAFLHARSPLHRASGIKRPLLIGQGGNDPRVKQAEADQMVAAMKANAIAVTYALYPDEGHGFGRPANALSFSILTELFLAHYLGGSFDAPAPDEAAGSSLELREADYWAREVFSEPRAIRTAP